MAAKTGSPIGFGDLIGPIGAIAEAHKRNPRAMERYYIHLINHFGQICDEEGHELADLEAARAVAREGIRSILSDEIMTGILDLRGRAEIRNASGSTLATMPFDETLEIRTGA